ncbi:nicotinamide riboside transporter PnuC [Brevibacillus choshinensis]|uniref:nicotinamide riboside transporter PnuC n=1 Tax=Brevibacillus choshinensis TaxID=54911 RepID=UPI002E24C651|nr:nicotinamide riboside transporter PnuC [Brevibacillus choshinensis]MED4753688.1 nicotinamide riboside transporter PnuC [Brevibacillus choshinensis]MED4781880.1 nicotinamide riboside transporter PnuC [Brevibacillus choshinensis]
MITKWTGYFADWSWFERLWLLAFTVVNVYLFFALDDTLIGLIASLTGMLSVVLVAKGKTWNYYPGIINVVLYAFVAYGQKYYGEVMLNLLYFLPMQFIGLFMWRKNGLSEEKRNDVRVAVMTNRARIYWSVLCLAVTVVYAWVLKTMGGALPFIDSLTAVLSIVAMIFMVKRFVEQWVVWIIIDVLTIYMWLVAFMGDGNDVSILVMWTAYLMNAIYGWLNWRTQYRMQKEEQVWGR